MRQSIPKIYSCNYNMIAYHMALLLKCYISKSCFCTLVLFPFFFQRKPATKSKRYVKSGFFIFLYAGKFLSKIFIMTSLELAR